MLLNILSIIEIVFVIIAVPTGGFIISHALKNSKKQLETPLKAFSSALLLYLLANWPIVDSSMRETFLIGLPLGNSPVALILYVVFTAGTVLGAFSKDIKDRISRR